MVNRLTNHWPTCWIPICLTCEIQHVDQLLSNKLTQDIQHVGQLLINKLDDKIQYVAQLLHRTRHAWKNACPPLAPRPLRVDRLEEYRFPLKIFLMCLEDISQLPLENSPALVFRMFWVWRCPDFALKRRRLVPSPGGRSLRGACKTKTRKI